MSAGEREKEENIWRGLIFGQRRRRKKEKDKEKNILRMRQTFMAEKQNIWQTHRHTDDMKVGLEFLIDYHTQLIFTWKFICCVPSQS